MTTYFAFKLQPITQYDIDTLLHNLDTSISAPQHTLHTQLSLATTDEVLAQAIEGLIVHFQDGAEGAGVLSMLLGVLKSTTHMLLRQLLGKHDNVEVNKMAQYLRERRVQLKGETHFGYVVPEDIAGPLLAVFSAIHRGEGLEQRAELNAIMLRFVDRGIYCLYDEFVQLIEVGFIKRKAVELGRATISKGLHTAMNKLIPGLNQAELEIFAHYYGNLLITT